MRVVDAMTAVMLIRTKSRDLLMAGRAGVQSIYGQLTIIKQFSPEFKSFLAQGIVPKSMLWLGKSFWNDLVQCGRTAIIGFFTGTSGVDEKADKAG